MIQSTGPDKAPASSTNTLGTATPEQSGHLQQSEQEALNLQELSLPSSLLADTIGKELAGPINTPARVVESGTRQFDTGVTIKVEALAA